MEQKDFGLVFAGGGGKGAYQIGVWKALRHLHMDTWIKGVSGDSVGALNAVLFANGDYQKAEDVWRKIHPIQFLDLTPDGVCSRDGLKRIMQREIDLSFVSNSNIRTYATIALCPPSAQAAGILTSTLSQTAADSEEWEGEYCLLNGKSPEEITQILLASTALPIVYDAVKIGDNYYRDGGLFDNMPMRPLLEDGLKHLILVKLNPDAEYDVILASQAETLIEITPSSSIGELLTGTLDFDGRNAVYRMQLGFYDTLRTIEFYERRTLGFPATPEEKARRIQQDREKALAAADASRTMDSIDRNRSKLDALFKRFDI